MITRLLSLATALLFSFSLLAQSTGTMDINDIHALFLSDGRLGWNPSTGTPSFEVPAGSGNHALFAAAPWIGGQDASGALHLAGLRFGQLGDEYWPGPLGTGATTNAANAAVWDNIYVITRAEVDAFLAGGPVTGNIADWPAHGDITQGQDFYIAPFSDVNNDGNYDPADGDYPCFPGDKALFFVFNDARVHGESGGAELGVEIHAMVYGYATSDPALDQTIFMHYTIKNQSSNTYSDTYFGLFADFDLGNPQDDYIGSDVSRGLFYAYNGDPNDEPTAIGGYGMQPPAFGIAMLQGPRVDADGMDTPAGNTLPAYTGVNFGDGIVDNERFGLASMSYFSNNVTGQGDPITAPEYYNYMQAKWRDGSNLLYGGTGHMSDALANPNQPSAFAFPMNSDPVGAATGGNVQATWSEAGLSNFPGDRRGVGAMGPFTMDPGEYIGIDFAFIFARASTGGPLGSVTALQSRTDSIRDFFFDNGIYSGPVNGGCAAIGPVNVQGLYADTPDIHLYPIPARDELTINVGGTLGRLDVVVHDLTGKVVATHLLSGGTATINTAHFQAGVYLLSLQTDTGTWVRRFVKR